VFLLLYVCIGIKGLHDMCYKNRLKKCKDNVFSKQPTNRITTRVDFITRHVKVIITKFLMEITFFWGGIFFLFIIVLQKFKNL